MAENKTRPTDASVERYLAAIEDDARRTDCEALVGSLLIRAAIPPDRLRVNSDLL